MGTLFRSTLAKVAACVFLCFPLLVQAEPLPLTHGTFWALDRITGRVNSLTIATGDWAKFGDLEIEIQACFRSSPDEPPESMAHVRVYEAVQGEPKTLIFEGWMFASSPGLNSLVHPIFDIWLKTCHGPEEAQGKGT